MWRLLGFLRSTGCVALALGQGLFLAAHGEDRELYPSPREALEEGYRWLHPRVLKSINSHSGWAIDDLGAQAHELPPGLLAQYSFTRGWATFGLALPTGLSFGGVAVGALETQTDVKTRWPDGSIRFAVVTAYVGNDSCLGLRPGPPSSGSFPSRLLEGLRVVVTVLPQAHTYTAELPADPAKDLWLSGPLVMEWRWEVAPVDAAGNPHPFLRLLFDYRAYNDDSVRWDITIENTLNTDSATSVEYTVQVLDQNRVLFERSTVTHPYLTRWRHRFGFRFKPSEVTPDFEPFHRARALPRFLRSVDNKTISLDSPRYDILRRGGNAYERMPAAGGRSELAPYPDVTAQYIVHKRKSQRQYVLKNGDLAGSWPVHIREANGDFLSLDRRPGFWLDPRSTDKPAGDLRSRGPLVPDNAHVPSWAYVPYLLTGDRYYADEMAFWANFALLHTSTYEDLRGTQGEGYLGPNNQVRGFGWGLRNLADAAAYLPEGHPLGSYLQKRVKNNLSWADAYALSFNGPPTGVTYLRSRRRTGQAMLAQWEHNYLAWALDHANQQGFAGGKQLLTRLTGFQSKLLTSEPDYPRHYGAPYLLAFGEQREDGRLYLYQTISEMFERNFRAEDGSLRSPLELNRDYAASARLSLMIYARIGAPSWLPEATARPHLGIPVGAQLRFLRDEATTPLLPGRVRH